MPRAKADWFRGLDKIFAPQTFLWPFLTPADFGAGCVLISLVAKGSPACPTSPLSSENSWRPLRPSTHTLAHALTSRDCKIGKCPVRVNQNVNVVILRRKAGGMRNFELPTPVETTGKSTSIANQLIEIQR
jgi:hypothetical protein